MDPEEQLAAGLRAAYRRDGLPRVDPSPALGNLLLPGEVLHFEFADVPVVPTGDLAPVAPLLVTSQRLIAGREATWQVSLGDVLALELLLAGVLVIARPRGAHLGSKEPRILRAHLAAVMESDHARRAAEDHESQ